MRVAWDARVLVNGPLRGMGTYALHLLPELRTAVPISNSCCSMMAAPSRLPIAGVRSKQYWTRPRLSMAVVGATRAPAARHDRSL